MVPESISGPGCSIHPIWTPKALLGEVGRVAPPHLSPMAAMRSSRRCAQHPGHFTEPSADVSRHNLTASLPLPPRLRCQSKEALWSLLPCSLLPSVGQHGTPPVSFQVQWFLGPNDTIRVLHNNQTVTFETQDAEGRLERATSRSLLLSPVRARGVPCAPGAVWGHGGNAMQQSRSPPLWVQKAGPAAGTPLPSFIQCKGPLFFLTSSSIPREKKVVCGIGRREGLSGHSRATLGVSSVPPEDGSSRAWWPQGADPAASSPACPSTGRETYNSSGLLLTRNGTQVSASFDGTVAITVMALSQILHASSSLPEEYQGRTDGLLGKQ